MNRYETILMVDTDTPEEEQEAIFEKIRTLIEKDGKLILFDDWGVKKFAYEIKKKRHGHYVRLDYCGMGGLVDELERILRLDFRVLKFMTIRAAVDVDPEAIIIEEGKDQEAEAQAAPEAKSEEGAAAAEEAPAKEAEAEASPETATEEKE